MGFVKTLLVITAMSIIAAEVGEWLVLVVLIAAAVDTYLHE